MAYPIPLLFDDEKNDRLDFEYMKRNSLWLDFKIIFQTLKFEDESY